MNVKFEKYDELRELSTLKDSPYQRNTHTDEQIKILAKIMKEDGVRQPIHVSRLTDTVCFGHGRREAARLNGWTDFPVVYQNFESAVQEWRCVQSDNGITAWAALDFAAINVDLAEMGPFDIELLGIKNFVVEPMDKFETPKEKELDENIDTKNICPSCGYKW